MANTAETKVLRGELARVVEALDESNNAHTIKDARIMELVGQVEQRDIIIEQRNTELKRVRAEGPQKDALIGSMHIQMLLVFGQTEPVPVDAADVQDMAMRLRYYENPHSPPSQNSLVTRKEKTNARKDSIRVQKAQAQKGTPGGIPQPQVVRDHKAQA